MDAFRHTEHLNILDLTTNSGFSLSSSDGLTVDDVVSMSESDLIEKYVEVYRDVTVTDDHIFALYSGKSTTQDSNVSTQTKSSIRIFDWEVNPLVLVNLGRELRRIAYDQRTKRLYALDHDQEIIVYYDLDDVI